MTDDPSDGLDGLVGTIESALDAMLLGALDAPLPALGAIGDPRRRELVARLCEVIVAQRRAALRLTHVAAAIDTAVGEVRDRIRIAAEANEGMASSAEGCQTSATELTTSARRISRQAKDLHITLATAAEAASRVSESGKRVARDSAVLSDAASDAATSSAAIASSMLEIDRALGALAAELSKTTSAVGSIDRSVRDIDAGAAETRLHSDEMAAVASHGRDVVTQTARAVEAIVGSIQGLERSAQHLEARSEEVSEITQIIKTVAVQSKLLSLNASIQAAHAGEAGRGFSVVAREIKQLSDSTGASARQIELLLATIRGEIAAAARQAQESNASAHRGLELANAAREAIDAISAEVDLIRSRVLLISQSTSSQTVETGNVRTAVGRVAELADRLRLTSGNHSAANQKVVERVHEISTLANGVRSAIAEQERATLGIIEFLHRLVEVVETLDTASTAQSAATEALAGGVSGIREAGRWSHASVASMAYTSDLLGQHVVALRDEVARVQLPSPVRGGRLTVPLTVPKPSLDPSLAFLEAHTMVIDCLFDRLVSYEENGRIAPALAETWEVSGDGLCYTFHLRHGTRFHHGREVTSDDVRFSLERLARHSDMGATILASVEGFDEYRSGATDALRGLETPAPDTIAIRLATPVAFFLGLVAMDLASVVPRELVESDPEGFAVAPSGTGPFRVSGSTERELHLARFDDYYDGERPYAEELEFRFDETADSALDGVLSGSYAFTYNIPRGRLEELLGNAEWRIRMQSLTLPHCAYLLMNPRAGGPLADPRVRRAVSHAVDRNRLVVRYNSVPTAVVAEGLIPPCCPGYDPTLRGPEHNPDLARALLAECGDVTRAPIRFVYGEGTRWIDDAMAAALVDDLAAIGLRLEPEPVKDVVAVRNSGDYDMVEARWIADYLDADAFTYWPFHSRLGRFRGLHESEVFDRMLEAARSETNPAERAAIYRRVHYMFQELCPAIVLLHGRVFVVQSPEVDGVRLYPLLPTVRPRDIWRAGGEE